MTASTVRVPAQDLEAERALLGAMMTGPEHAALSLRPDDWYSPQNGQIHEAIAHLYASNAPTDPVAVSAEMQRRGTLPVVGGHLTIFDIAESCATPASAPHYTGIVRAHGLVRRVQRAAGEIHESGYGAVDDAKDYADRAEATMFAATDDVARGNILPVSMVVGDVLALAERAAQGDPVSLGVPTGLTGIDRILGGLHGGNLVLVAARPSLGKSSLGFQVARHVSGLGKRVLLWSIEMSVQEVGLRLMAAQGRISTERMLDGRLNNAEWQRAVEAEAVLSSLPLFVAEGGGTSPLDIRAGARRTKPDMIVVDYVQLLTYPGRHEHRESEVSAISRSLKGLAMELHIPVLALAQLNREMERANRAPVLSDLRDSGSLEQDSDAVILLHRDPKGPIVAHVAKHRNGPTGKANLRFLDQYAVFEDGAA